MQWCEQTRNDFRLGPQIDAQLKQRKFKLGVTFTHGEWRRMQRENPASLAAVGFRDDPTKGAAEELRLEMEGRPEWTPGRSMKPPRTRTRRP